jgi:hypothetical protein
MIRWPDAQGCRCDLNTTIQLPSLPQGSQTQSDRRATFKRKNAPRATVYWKKAYAGRKLLEKLQK